MNKNRYAKAYKEVLEIIKYFSREDFSKIPIEKIQFMKENMDTNYEFEFDPLVPLSEQNISKKAYAIIIVLFENYFATEKQKIAIHEILRLNEYKAELEKRKKYNPDDLFKKNK